MGKPAFIFTDYHPSATVTATDTLTGTDADNILLATEDTVWSPADATGTKDITIDLFSAFAFDHIAFLGKNLNGLEVLTSTSSDDFVADINYATNTDIAENGDLALPPAGTGNADSGTIAAANGWAYNANVSWRWFSSSSGYVTFKMNAVDASTVGFRIDNILTSGTTYKVRLTIADFTAGSTISIKLVSGANSSATLTTEGVHDLTIVADGDFFYFDTTGTILTGGTPAYAYTVDDIFVWEPQSIESTNNTALLALALPSSDRYLKVSILNPSTSLQIAHIAPDTLIEQPWLEDDWGTEGVQSEFKNLISVDGYYLGTTQTKTMRDININFGEITDTEYTGQVEPWVTSRIKTSSAFFFIPDVDDLTEIYFCWLVDGQGFKAPLKQGVRMAEAIRCLTRLA